MILKLIPASKGGEGPNPVDSKLLEDALTNLDSLRAAIIEGRIKAFFAVGVAADHTTYCWIGKRQETTVLEMQGAWHAMARSIDSGELNA